LGGEMPGLKQVPHFLELFTPIKIPGGVLLSHSIDGLINQTIDSQPAKQSLSFSFPSSADTLPTHLPSSMGGKMWVAGKWKMGKRELARKCHVSGDVSPCDLKIFASVEAKIVNNNKRFIGAALTTISR